MVSAASERLAARGWMTADGTLTEAGHAAREDIQAETDRLALQPYAALGPDRVDDLFAALRPLAGAVIAAGGVPTPNPVGAPWPPRDVS